jgi:hypothetical protein
MYELGFYIPGDSVPHIQRRENLKYNKSIAVQKPGSANFILFPSLNILERVASCYQLFNI